MKAFPSICPVRCLAWGTMFLLASSITPAQEPVELVGNVPEQPLSANIERIVAALEMLGRPFPEDVCQQLDKALASRSPLTLQQELDKQVLAVVHINPEYRVKVSRGPARPELVQSGFTPVLIKVINEAASTERLRISSPQAGPVYAGAARLSLERQEQTQLGENENQANSRNRIFDVEMFTGAPLTTHLSGLDVEYVLALLSCSEAGPREATLGFDVGQGTQDLGFRGEIPVLFQVRPAIPVSLQIRDFDGVPSTARLEIRDSQGHVYPPQSKRVAPDLFFQPQVYRRDGDTLKLPPGTYTVETSRGPEYVVQQSTLTIPEGSVGETFSVPLKRWVNPLEAGFVSGDHHIHGAGCAHYQVPTEGVSPFDMFQQVKGEGLNVGCVLTWGPCFDFQRQYFSPAADLVSEPLTLLKYDLEISGFGSAAMGHVCLLNLRDQTYPGSEGSKLKGWPTWTVPVMKWAKEQGGVTGYPHSDMQIDPEGYSQRLLRRWDTDGDSLLTAEELTTALLAEPFSRIDADQNGLVSLQELISSADRASQKLPHLVLPSMRGSGAMEVFVSTAEGVCDFTSAMDTGRIGEWNTWYHIMNAGFPLKLSGETDFPCMSSRRVGQGRVYVRMDGDVTNGIDFPAWCRGLAEGRSYVSDGYAHALEFQVAGQRPGPTAVPLSSPATVDVLARVSFAPQTPRGVAYGTEEAPEGPRETGDTRILHRPRNDTWIAGGEKVVELIQNGQVIARKTVPADGQVHELTFSIPIEFSSWIALRQFPQLHTNPVQILVADQPIRASSASARWCAESVDLLWENRSRLISTDEREAAKEAYERAREEYSSRARQAAEAGR